MMKIEIFLHLSFMNAFIPFSIISASSTPQPHIFYFHSLGNESVNPNLDSTPFSLKEASANTTTSSVSSTILRKSEYLQNDKKTTRSINQFHIIKIKPEYLRKPSMDKLNERAEYENLSPFHRNFNNFLKLFNYKFQKKRGFYFDSIYPETYHHNYIEEYGRNTYHPHLFSSYRIRSFPKPFKNRRNKLDNFMFSNHVQYPEKEFASYSSETDAVPSNTNDQKFLFLPSDVHEREHNFPAISGIRTNGTVTSSSQKKPSNKSYAMRNFLNMTSQKPEEISSATLHLAKNIAGTERFFENDVIWNRSLTGEENFYPGESEVLDIQNGVLVLSKFEEFEQSDKHLPSDKQGILEPTNQQTNFNTENLNLLASNRVYFEKLPENLNLSWFVYANCSQNKCQYINSTNETELIRGGWIMHNCTNYGCTEMYPKTEQIHTFIGVMLLVFSLCIAIITVVVLVLNYFRHMNLSKSRSATRNPLSWDEKNPLLHETPNDKTSDIFLKRNKRQLSRIPVLEKRIKITVGNRNGLEIENVEHKTSQKPSTKCEKQHTGQDADLLLMNLDDEINTNDLVSPCNTEKASNMKDLLKNDCPSFISINFSD